MRHTLASVLLLTGLVVSVAQSHGDEDHNEASRNSVQAVREAGVSMMRWLEEVLPTDTETPKVPKRMYWEQCTPTTYELVVERLGPEFGGDLPRVDGWGHALQFCLEVDRDGYPAERFAVAIRSPGRDGEFADRPYEPGAFDSEDVDRDLVWRNGFFFTWPERRTDR